MAMVVQHNLTAMNANRMLGITTGSQAKSTEKLSSGYKINRAADDAAGLTISEKMRKQMRGLDRASTNAQDGISCVQTAEGALTEVHSMLQRMNELAVQAANGTMSEKDRQATQDEIDQLVTEIDRVSATTKFNEIYLLKGDPATSKTETTKTYKYELTAVAKNALNGGTLKVKAGQDAYGKGQTTAVIASTPATTTPGTGSMALNQAALDALATGAGTKLFASSDGTQANYKEVNAGNLATYFDVDATGTVTPKAGATFGTAASTATEAGVAGGAPITTPADPTAFVTGTAGTPTTTPAVTGDLEQYVEIGEDGKLKYKDGQMLYKKPADATGQFGDQTEAEQIAEDKLDQYFEIDSNPLTDSAGKKLTEKEILAKFENGVYKGGLHLKDNAGNVTEIGAEQIAAYVTTTPGADKTTTTADSLVFKLHVGSESAANNKIDVTIKAMSSTGIGVDVLSGNGLMTQDSATQAIQTIADAIDAVSKQRSALGAIQNRLEHTIANLDNIVENTTAAESRIRDTDMAEEMVEYSKNNILAQAGQSMLAQANQSTQGVLSLLG